MVNPDDQTNENFGWVLTLKIESTEATRENEMMGSAVFHPQKVQIV
jgi:hypothetical protein